MAMRPSLRSRFRRGWLWMGFVVAALATVLAVQRLYATAQRELAERSRIALQQAREKALERIRATSDELRHATMRELAGFHVEGLAHTLQRWDEASAEIVGTFEWDAARGFRLEPAELRAAEWDEPERLWREFRQWRALHPAVQTREPVMMGARRSASFRMLENPRFPAAELRYQSENLDMLAYDGRAIDPWAGWAAHVESPEAPWLFWYQLSADSPVRGCLLDVRPFVDRLRTEFADRQLARLDLVPVSELERTGSGTNVGEVIALDGLPGYALLAESGGLFRERQGGARFAGWAVALLLGLFFVGVAALAIFSRRETRNAERKTTFVSQVSHELRTPLTSIRMFADMLVAPTLTDERRLKYAATIGRESRRLGELIERLLTFQALEKGKLSLPVAPLDVAAVARETIEEMATMIEAAGMRITAEIPEHAALALGERGAVKQALLNLIDNAIKYARQGGAVHVALSSGTEVVRLRVADRGPGIERALRPRLFEPFVQGGSQTLTDKPPGVGLGLSIARGLLRHTGGDLVLVNTDGGATFEIRLPAATTS